MSDGTTATDKSSQVIAGDPAAVNEVAMFATPAQVRAMYVVLTDIERDWQTSPGQEVLPLHINNVIATLKLVRGES